MLNKDLVLAHGDDIRDCAKDARKAKAARVSKDVIQSFDDDDIVKLVNEIFAQQSKSTLAAMDDGDKEIFVHKLGTFKILPKYEKEETEY